MYLCDIIDADGCNDFRREQGEPVAAHFPAGDYTRDELIDLYRYAECPLHVTPDYPQVPEGVWRRDVFLAADAVNQIGDRLGPRTTTRSPKLAPVWATYPHARWWYDLHTLRMPPGETRPCRCDGCTSIATPED